jgi:hypothetical protein
MFTPEQIEKAKTLPKEISPIYPETIIGFVLGQSVFLLKKEQAEKTWMYNFSIKEFEDFEKNSSSLLEKHLASYQRHIKNGKEAFFKECGIENKHIEVPKEFTSKEETLMTDFLLKKKFPEWKGTYEDLNEKIEDLIESQKLDIVDYVTKTIIPIIEEYRNSKKQKMDE